MDQRNLMASPEFENSKGKRKWDLNDLFDSTRLLMSPWRWALTSVEKKILTQWLRVGQYKLLRGVIATNVFSSILFEILGRRNRRNSNNFLYAWNFPLKIEEFRKASSFNLFAKFNIVQKLKQSIFEEIPYSMLRGKSLIPAQHVHQIFASNFSI